MAQIDAIIAARTLHGPVACGEDNRLTLIGNDDLRLGLRTRLLLDENKFSAFPIAALLTEQKYHLQGKADFAVEILMKTVVATGLVVKHKRCGPRLPRFVASFQESCMVARISRNVFTEGFRPLIGYFGEVRISAASEIGDQFWKRVGEVLVVADAEAIALHDDVAAKTACITI